MDFLKSAHTNHAAAWMLGTLWGVFGMIGGWALLALVPVVALYVVTVSRVS